jgi:hypothetical protein
MAFISPPQSALAGRGGYHHLSKRVVYELALSTDLESASQSRAEHATMHLLSAADPTCAGRAQRLERFSLYGDVDTHAVCSRVRRAGQLRGTKGGWPSIPIAAPI